MEIAKNRYDFIDWGKAIGIALICIGHFCPKDSASRIFLYTFHVPLFFVIGGFLCRKTDSMEQLYKSYKKQTKRLLFPYSFWFLLSCIPAIFIFKSDICFCLKKFLFLDGTMIWNSALWFIPCFYMTSLIVQACLRLGAENGILIGTGIIGFSIAIVCDKYQITNCLFGLNKVALLTGYYVIGYLLKQYWTSILKNSKIISSCGISLFMVLGAISVILNNGNNISILNLDYNYIYIYIILSVLMAVSLLGSLLVFQQNPIIVLISNNTLFIMCMHLFFPPIITKVISISNELMGICTGCGVFLISCFIVNLCNKVKIDERIQVMLGLKLMK